MTHIDIAHPGPADILGVETESPRGDIIWGGAAAVAFVVALGGATLLAPFDAAIYASGQVEVSGARQAVQHREGGAVSALFVHEGDRVTKGQPLLQLNADEIDAGERSIQAQVIELQALKARLVAELGGRGGVVAPAEFADLTGRDRDVATAAMALQQRQFQVRREALSTGASVLTQRSREAAEQINGFRQQLTANRQQQALIDQEISAVKGLMDKGLVPATRMRSLQRNASELSGNQGQYDADVAKTQAEISENRMRVANLVQERSAEDSKDLQTTEFQLAELEPKLVAFKAQLDHAVLKAPVTGRVLGLSVLSVGGVAAPGQLLMSIVPEGPALVVQFKVKPADVSNLKIGAPTDIRVSALHDLGVRVLKASVTKISPDSFVDEKSGVSYFRAEASVSGAEMKTLESALKRPSILYPGLPVEVVIPLRKRTAWEYLTEPLNRRLWGSFREQ